MTRKKRRKLAAAGLPIPPKGGWMAPARAIEEFKASLREETAFNEMLHRWSLEMLRAVREGRGPEPQITGGAFAPR